MVDERLYIAELFGLTGDRVVDRHSAQDPFKGLLVLPVLNLQPEDLVHDPGLRLQAPVRHIDAVLVLDQIRHPVLFQKSDQRLHPLRPERPVADLLVPHVDIGAGAHDQPVKRIIGQEPGIDLRPAPPRAQEQFVSVLLGPSQRLLRGSGHLAVEPHERSVYVKKQYFFLQMLTSDSIVSRRARPSGSGKPQAPNCAGMLRRMAGATLRLPCGSPRSPSAAGPAAPQITSH